MCLKLVKANESDGDTSLPFILRRLVGREYHVGPNGVTIGTSPTCDIMLPGEGDILPEHCHIKHVKSSKDSNGTTQLSNTFVLEDLTNGHGTILVTKSSDNDEVVSDATTKTYSFSRGVQFVTGKLVWNLVALPEELAFRANVFHLAKNGCLAQLKDVLEVPPTVPKLTITGNELQKILRSNSLTLMCLSSLHVCGTTGSYVDICLVIHSHIYCYKGNMC